MYITYYKNYYLIKNKFKTFFEFLNLHIPFSKTEILNNLYNWYTVWIRYNSCKHTIFSGLNIHFYWTIGYYSIWC